jgi:hypothetical protein
MKYSLMRKGEFVMDSVTVVRIVAGILFVAVLVLLIQRRRNKGLN